MVELGAEPISSESDTFAPCAPFMPNGIVVLIIGITRDQSLQCALYRGTPRQEPGNGQHSHSEYDSWRHWTHSL